MVNAVRECSNKAGNQLGIADVDDDIDRRVRATACALCEAAAALNDGHDPVSRGRNLVEKGFVYGQGAR